MPWGRLHPTWDPGMQASRGLFSSVTGSALGPQGMRISSKLTQRKDAVNKYPNTISTPGWLQGIPLCPVCWGTGPPRSKCASPACAARHPGTWAAWTRGSPASPGWAGTQQPGSLWQPHAWHCTDTLPERKRQTLSLAFITCSLDANDARSRFTCTMVGLSPEPIRYRGLLQMRSEKASSSPFSTAFRSLAVRSCVRGFL